MRSNCFRSPGCSPMLTLHGAPRVRYTNGKQSSPHYRATEGVLQCAQSLRCGCIFVFGNQYIKHKNSITPIFPHPVAQMRCCGDVDDVLCVSSVALGHKFARALCMLRSVQCVYLSYRSNFQDLQHPRLAAVLVALVAR